MINQSSIEQVISTARIDEVVSKFVELKKAGANFKGFSPFGQEKSPSFVVSPAKNIFKCFSSGIGGDAIAFLQESQNMNFIEAVEWLADFYNITLERTESKQTPEERDHLAELDLTQRRVIRTYQQILSSEAGLAGRGYLTEERGYDDDVIVEWGLGYAPDEWRTITDKVVDKGALGLCIELGFCANKNERNYDVLRNRIIFPIHNHNGKVVGHGARYIGQEKEAPKYINSPDTPIYNKSRVLYGLHKAKKAIQTAGFAYLVEGYTDVISLHQADVCNTVASCGTAITPEQIALLSRFCKHLVVLLDSDKAGSKGSETAIILALKAGMKADIIRLEKGEDPDSLVRQMHQGELAEA